MGFVENVNKTAQSITSVDTVATDIVKVNNYYDTYLGEGTTNPSTRRDGSPLLGGEQFFNTQARKMLVFYANTGVWIQSPGGQFVDTGTDIGSGVQYMAQVSGVEDIVIKSGTNAFSVDSFTLADGATLTIEDGAVYKVL